MTILTEIKIAYDGLEVEWQTTLCKNCRKQITRNRYVNPHYENTFSKWKHSQGRECVFYAESEED